jgi:hypothetical protein
MTGGFVERAFRQVRLSIGGYEFINATVINNPSYYNHDEDEKMLALEVISTNLNGQITPFENHAITIHMDERAQRNLMLLLEANLDSESVAAERLPVALEKTRYSMLWHD